SWRHLVEAPIGTKRIEPRFFSIKFLAKVYFVRIALADVPLEVGKCRKIGRFVHPVFQPALKPRRFLCKLDSVDLIDNTPRIIAFDFSVKLSDEQGISGHKKIGVRKSSTVGMSGLKVFKLIL